MEDFVTYEQALKLKELGFDWPCDYHYEDNRDLLGLINLINVHEFYHMTGVKLDDGLPAPTLAQAQKWLREVKRMSILIDILSDSKEYYWRIFNSEDDFVGPSDNDYNSYEESLSNGINKVIEILKSL